MPRPESIISLDPIDRKKNKGFIGRLLITQWSGGRSVQKSIPYGHYMFCGPQGSGKTSSVLWYAESLAKKYKRRRISVRDENDNLIKFDTPPKILLWSNFGVGTPFKKEDLFSLIDKFDPYANEIRIILVDEIHTYFPRGTVSKETGLLISQLTAVFSQLRKRNVFLLSTAQVYGRLDKALREQCLFMVNCKVNLNKRLVNDFIPGDDIIADELGRWAGNPKFIRVHGLSKLEYDTKRLIRE